MCFAERSVAIVPEHVERLTAFDAYTGQPMSQELYPFLFGFIRDFAFEKEPETVIAEMEAAVLLGSRISS
jgi:hypothetical protein